MLYTLDALHLYMLNALHPKWQARTIGGSGQRISTTAHPPTTGLSSLRSPPTLSCAHSHTLSLCSAVSDTPPAVSDTLSAVSNTLVSQLNEAPLASTTARPAITGLSSLRYHPTLSCAHSLTLSLCSAVSDTPPAVSDTRSAVSTTLFSKPSPRVVHAPRCVVHTHSRDVPTPP